MLHKTSIKCVQVKGFSFPASDGPKYPNVFNLSNLKAASAIER